MMFIFNMEKSKSKLQFIFAFIFILITLGFGFYAYNQLQLNSDSKKIIDSNNNLMSGFSDSVEASLEPFKNIDSLNFENSKKDELITVLNGFPPQTESIKNQLKPGVNYPSNNNFNLINSKLETLSNVSNNLSIILDIKLCFKEKYGAYSSTLNSIASVQDEIATAGSFMESKDALEKLKLEYGKLFTHGSEVEQCLDEEFKDLKTSIAQSNNSDKESIDKYQTEYLDPIIAIYASNDTAKIGEFIDQNSAVSVVLKLPALFDNSTELSIADKVLEDKIDSQIARI